MKGVLSWLVHLAQFVIHFSLQSYLDLTQRDLRGVAPASADLLKLKQMGTLGVHMKGVPPC
jgi:hypothetical protein